MSALTLTPLTQIPLIRHGDNLADILVGALQVNDILLEDLDVLVIAQKIVSKAEGRLVRLAEVTPSARARELAVKVEKDARLVELMLQESSDVLRMFSSGEVIRSVRGAMAGSGLGLGEQFDEQREHLVAVLAGQAEGELGGEQAVVEIDVVASALQFVGEVAFAACGLGQRG